MQTCKTCKWWEGMPSQKCDRPDSLPDPPILFEIEIGADDDSGLYGRLVTGPDFGCVLHEPNSLATGEEPGMTVHTQQIIKQIVDAAFDRIDGVLPLRNDALTLFGSNPAYAPFIRGCIETAAEGIRLVLSLDGPAPRLNELIDIGQFDDEVRRLNESRKTADDPDARKMAVARVALNIIKAT